MARKTRRRRYSRRRSRKVSESIVTYQRIVKLSVTTGSADATSIDSGDVDDVHNMGGETVNRKIIGVRGTLSFATQPPAGDLTVAMWALWAHPAEQDVPSLDDFNPFTAGPTGSDTYKGRPSPRPFARKYFSHILQSSGTATQHFTQFRVNSKAQRLLRPGWKLTNLLYVRSDVATQKAAVGGVISVAVEG